MVEKIGPVRSNGFGPMVCPDSEILAFLKGIKFDFEDWEFLTIRKMCAAYLSGYNSGKDIMSKMPMDRDYNQMLDNDE